MPLERSAAMDIKPNPEVFVGEGEGRVLFSQSSRFALIAGPCQMESRDHAFMIAGRLKELCAELGIGLVYKSSFDKANRTSLSGKRGIGLDKAMEVFGGPEEGIRLPGSHRHSHGRTVRTGRAHGRYPADTRLPLPPDRSADRRREDRSRHQR
jgi:hypothetical protein